MNNVKISRRMLSVPMPGGMEFRIADGATCRFGHNLRCHPEPLENPYSFRLICPRCTFDFLIYDRAS
jgi:hypothetical protein